MTGPRGWIYTTSRDMTDPPATIRWSWSMKAGRLYAPELSGAEIGIEEPSVHVLPPSRLRIVHHRAADRANSIADPPGITSIHYRTNGSDTRSAHSDHQR